MIVYNTFEVSVVQASLIWKPMSSWFDRAFKSKCLCVASLELLAHAAASTFFYFATSVCGVQYRHQVLFVEK